MDSKPEFKRKLKFGDRAQLLFSGISLEQLEKEMGTVDHYDENDDDDLSVCYVLPLNAPFFSMSEFSFTLLCH